MSETPTTPPPVPGGRPQAGSRPAHPRRPRHDHQHRLPRRRQHAEPRPRLPRRGVPDDVGLRRLGRHPRRPLHADVPAPGRHRRQVHPAGRGRPGARVSQGDDVRAVDRGDRARRRPAARARDGARHGQRRRSSRPRSSRCSSCPPRRCRRRCGSSTARWTSRASASCRSLDPIAGFVIAVALLIAGWNYWALIVGVVAGAWVGAIVSLRASPYRFRWTFDRATARSYASFSWPLFFAGTSGIVVGQGLLIVGEAELGLAGVGIIALASSISQYSDRADQAITQTIYPTICAVKDRAELLYEAFVKSNRLALMWGAPFGLGLARVRRGHRALRDRRGVAAGDRPHAGDRRLGRRAPDRLQLGRLLPRARRHEAGRDRRRDRDRRVPRDRAAAAGQRRPGRAWRSRRCSSRA